MPGVVLVTVLRVGRSFVVRRGVYAEELHSGVGKVGVLLERGVGGPDVACACCGATRLRAPASAHRAAGKTCATVSTSAYVRGPSTNGRPARDAQFLMCDLRDGVPEEERVVERDGIRGARARPHWAACSSRRRGCACRPR